MKILRILPIIGVFVVFVSCGALDKLNQPISKSDYNPLDSFWGGSGSGNSSVNGSALVNSNNHGFNHGDIVEVVIRNTALFEKVPKAGDRFKKVLKVGDILRVIGGEKDFIEVVTETGETGFVSSVMVVTQGLLTNTVPIDPSVIAPGANGIPIVPDVAPDPLVQGIGSPDPTLGIAPEPVPSITAPIPVDPKAGLIVPDNIVTPNPVVPDPTPVVPSLPDVPAPEPSSPELSE
ncbi:MAG: hypothetical protein ACI9SQ_000683 [Rubritalea sp.]|jgi:hypothetical protein